MPAHSVNRDKQIRIPCDKCGRKHYISKTAAQCNHGLTRRCVRCLPSKICKNCGRPYKKHHKCPLRPTVLVVKNGSKRRPRKLTPRERHRFCTVECNSDDTHLHLADITVSGPIRARCNRNLVATKLLRYLPIAVWGLLDADDIETPKFAGRWCRRCLVAAMGLIGSNSVLRFAREVGEDD
jgi:hypothetical protein